MKFAADENFNNRILRGLLRRQSDLDVVRIQGTEIGGAGDPAILAWAAREGRILLTHDQKTMPDFVYERIQAGELVAGVIVARKSLLIATVIEELLLIIACSSASDWVNKVERLPL